MKANRGRDTGPELSIRKRLFELGMRYRVNYRPIPGVRRTIDIAFPRQQLAVFVDGCFWHGCPNHGTTPKTNHEFWSAKFARTQERDTDTVVQLTRAGWSCLRYWEHDDPESVVLDISRHHCDFSQ
jgi:DNA mismatch endonuclease (patch repair protein)